ncbi:hypothetical protein A2311_03185 [candidate division WOR-1 bacterium RIFOXYB2_FULL_48_7]|uniref:UDP-N-acetylmuramyl-tripeptide synthetase n=1 Tax=candidate division WOR-1 bacterium RIFOXYB2_FULL_48_7 TaxID=1802583 RepID=A0A1F4T8E1_UNCSA|nr:MAG: hypothetical protein A2311_03185 [candidate division WOR-1 bacterium RIFOXYB2_FULL_48_7]
MIIYDSRQVRPGDTFVAIPGLKHDGLEFVAQAVANGATTIVAEKSVVVPAGVKTVKVPSARLALAELSAEYYGQPSKKLKLIGITGTKGKSTTAFLVQAIINQAGYKSGLIGTITHPMTTPESADLQAELAKMVEQGYTHCVLEVSSHALAQERVHACHFSVAIFTNLSHDHLDYHKTKEEYMLAKKKLFAMLPRDGFAIINIDDPAGEKMIGAVKGEVITYGIGQAKHELRSTKHNEYDTDVHSIDIRQREMTLKINTLDVKTPLIGLHNVYNIAAAWQTGLILGIRPIIIKKGLESVKVIPGRQEEIIAGQLFRVIVDFAHSPDSLQKLLETYKPLTKGRIILVFGCPGDRDRAKRPLMGELAARLADVVIITTDDPHSEEPAAIIEEIRQRAGERAKIILDRRAAIVQAIKLAKTGDILLIAGRGHEQSQDFQGKKIMLDDRQVVLESLKEYKSFRNKA